MALTNATTNNPNHGHPADAPQLMSCSACHLNPLCLPCGLSAEEQGRLVELIVHHRHVTRGECLFRSGDPFTAIYILHAGFFKTEVLLPDGRSQVTGFQMAAEMLGLDGIGTDHHTCNAVALENSDVCVIPFDRMSDLLREIGPLQSHFHKLMSREIVRDHRVMMLLGTMRSEERLAAFLINLSKRFTTRGFSPAEFNLRMTREEIGSYLGLKLETVSRAFSRFNEAGLISVQQKRIRILDIDALQRLLTPNTV